MTSLSIHNSKTIKITPSFRHREWAHCSNYRAEFYT